MSRQKRRSDSYAIIKSRSVTEKSVILEQLQESNSNPYVDRCKAPKYVFIVDKQSNKQEIADAIEEIYKDRHVKVVSVNTLIVKPKPKGRGRRHRGQTATYKKAIVTFEPGDSIDMI